METMSEMLNEARAEIEALRPARSEALPPLASPMTIGEILSGPNPFFEIVDGAVQIYWGGYDYDPTLGEIRDPLALLGLISHLSDKAWPLMSPERIGMLIDAICEAKGWNHHTGEIKAIQTA